MRIAALMLGAIVFIASTGCSDNQSSGGGLTGVWGSTQAGLRFTNGSARLLIVADGNCYGSYAETSQPIPNGEFAVAGTYTQLTGAYPGQVQYPAEITGTVTGSRLSITVTVPALPRTVGPFELTRGVDATWPGCAYP